MIKRRFRLLVMPLVFGLLASGHQPGQALYRPHAHLVSEDPADYTPHVVDGKVTTILPVGDRIFVGGTFTGVKNQRVSGGGDPPVLAKQGLFALDAKTGRVDEAFTANFDVSPDPTVDRAVEALAADPDGNAIFVGGSFGLLNGVTARKLVKLDATTGAADANFKMSLSSAVKDLVVDNSRNRLYVAGAFTRINSADRSGLAAVDADTGAVASGVDIPFTEPRFPGSTLRVETIGLTPDGTTLVAAGNFLKAAGEDRVQIALLDVGGTTARLLDWHTDDYNERRADLVSDTNPYGFICKSFDSYMRDLDISPDGTYFVVVTTGAHHRNTLCDSAARWEISARGSNLHPTWVDYDGGDSFTAVAITGSAVYVGGHMRWMNNPFPQKTSDPGIPGPGNVEREGIAALDPKSGLPLPWNPRRERGEGAWSLVSTDDGLWVGSDTNFIGNRDFNGSPRTGEWHQKLAFLPLEGGKSVPSFDPHTTLPADLYTAGLDGELRRRFFSGSVLGTATELPSNFDWNTTRGAFWVGGRLYTGRSDGRLMMQTFNGSSLGPAVEVDRRGLTTSHFNIPNVTGMFYDNGRLYYTLEGQKALFYRFFYAGADVADDVIGALSLVADDSANDWSKVSGMSMAGGHIYWSENGALHRMEFRDGKPRGSDTVVISGAGLDSRAMFAMPQTTTAPPASIDPPSPPGSNPTPDPGTGPATSGRSGYWMVGSDGRVYAFGDAVHMGDAAPHLGGAEAVDLEPTPSFNGYWIVDDRGRVFGFGDARHHGNVDLSRLVRGERVTSLSATPSGNGYWIFTSIGRAIRFGDAGGFGDMSAVPLNGPVLDSIRTPSGKGYYMVASDGGIFSFGDAEFYGSMGGIPLNAPVQSLVPDPDGRGYWLVAADGGVFAFESPFRGSMGATRLNKPMTGMVPFGNAYLMVAEDGGIFNFATDKDFYGSLGANPPARPVVSVAALDE